MRSAISLLAAPTILVIVAWLAAPQYAVGQKPEQNTDQKTSSAPAGEPPVEEEEAPPPPEAPYPGAAQKEESSAPTKTTQRARDSSANTRPESNPEPLNERPKSVNEDGDYVYDTKKETPATFSGRSGITAPKSSTPDGEYLYEKTDEQNGKGDSFSGRPGVEPPVSTSSTGEYRYKTETHVATKSASFHVGVITPPNITNPDNGITFSTIYGGNPAPILFVDYEFYRLNTAIGRLGIKFGSGIFAANGQGQWETPRPASQGLPYETFTWVMFPNTLTALYKFQWADQQWVVPYIEGGPGYFTFAEVRSDIKMIRGGGSPAVVGIGGLNFLLDKLDPRAIRELDLEYGINHLWLSLEARGILGLESDVNFTSVAFSAGFLMEF